MDRKPHHPPHHQGNAVLHQAQLPELQQGHAEHTCPLGSRGSNGAPARCRQLDHLLHVLPDLHRSLAVLEEQLLWSSRRDVPTAEQLKVHRSGNAPDPEWDYRGEHVILPGKYDTEREMSAAGKDEEKQLSSSLLWPSCPGYTPFKLSPRLGNSSTQTGAIQKSPYNNQDNPGSKCKAVWSLSTTQTHATHINTVPSRGAVAPESPWKGGRRRGGEQKGRWKKAPSPSLGSTSFQDALNPVSTTMLLDVK
ncbi:hypothetical protein DPEC_G00183210 [Dallia pectoralis]|uniref:Uncharacterized protein n=1 Tax=Dallia pectoralis TaxID=75939 RepID=A0ACC2GB62_DALPE|nr:hypothetical protein DPEC_G00183210 [Dallia pectoralis]